MLFEETKLRFEISIEDSAYPELLKSISSPPKRLYGIGDPNAIKPGVAIIGARKATPYGLSCVRLFARHAAKRGLTIVSGGARGCDQAAHQAAVDEDVPTVVVFGSSPDIVYPKQGKKLFEQVIKQGGAIISEQPWGTHPLPQYFPLRNRIIAGLSLLLLIAEAGLPSGTFSTADAALSAGRDVAVVPGSILSAYSKGANKLLCQGATPVIDIDSFDSALEAAFERYPLSMLCASQSENLVVDLQEKIKNDSVLEALAGQAYSPDELAAYYGFSSAELSKRLSQYEMQGLVDRNRDGRYFFVLSNNDYR